MRNEGDDEAHSDFDPTYTTEDGQIKFALTEERKDTFEYYLKVTALGGETYATDSSRTFTVECGVLSATIVESEFEPGVYNLDGRRPSFTIAAFSTESETEPPLCPIDRYWLAETEDAVEGHPSFIGDGAVDG